MTVLNTRGLTELIIDDEWSFKHVALYGQLKQRLIRDDVRFKVARAGSQVARWDQVQLLNLTYWSPTGPAEVLLDDVIAADGLTHSAWHHICAQALGEHANTVDGLLLGESIASAFDLYLVGRLLPHAPESHFLESQVPAMAESAEEAGLNRAGFEALLETMSRRPEASFEELRELLFDAGSALVACHTVDEASDILNNLADRPFAALLHRYEISNWVLFAKAYADGSEPCAAVRAIDTALREADDAIAWLEEEWLSD